MPLSEYEQRVLEQMERELTSDDPRLATTMNTTAVRSSGRYVIAGIGLVVGLLTLVLGVAQTLPWVGVIGFVVMFVAVAYAFSQPGKAKKGPMGVVSDSGSVHPRRQGKSVKSAKAGKKQTKRGFMQRLEDRWDKREQGE